MKEIGIENADARNAVNGQIVLCGGASDRFGRWRIVDAEGLLSIVTDVRMNPRHIVFTVAQHDRPASCGAFVVTGKLQTLRKSSFNQIARHAMSPSLLANVQAAGRVKKRAPTAHRACYLF